MADDFNSVNTGALFNAPEGSLDQMVASGYITPQQKQEIQLQTENQAGAAVRAEQDAALQAESQAAVQTPLGQQQAQQAADTQEAQFMEGTGIRPGFQPIKTPLSPVGTPFSGLPSTLQAPVEEIQAQEDAIAVRQGAQEAAQQNAQIAKAKHAADLQQAADQKSAKVEGQVRADLKTSGSSLMSNIGDAIAIMLGAYSQGLTGNKENPGLKAVESRIAKEVEKRKYNAEQEAALRKLAVDAAHLRLAQMKQQTDNTKTLAEIEKLQAETGKLRTENQQSKNILQLINKPSYSRDELLEIPGKEGDQVRIMAIPLPFTPGRFVRAASNEAGADNLRKYMGESGSIIPEIDQIIEFSTSPDFNKLGPNDRAKVQTKLAALVGSLRIPLTGPGPMTDSEREFLFNTLGDPSKLFTLKDWQLTRLKEVRSTIRGRIKSAYRNLGNIDIPDAANSIQDQRFATEGKNPELVEQARRNLLAKKRK